MGENTFSGGVDHWLDRLGNLRNVVRQEVVSRQLDRHLPTGRPLRVLDVGAGQGTQALRLARQGHTVCAVEPDPRMRTAFEAALAALGAGAQERVTLLAGDLTELGSLTDPAAYDLVLCHGVLMYLPESQSAIASLASRTAPDAILSVVARNGDALAWRPASRHDWVAAAALLDEQEEASAHGRDPLYENEIGIHARGDRVEDLLRTVEAEGFDVLAWYGVRLASDDVAVETPVPPEDELSVLLDVEERLGRTDPYRRLGTLVHVIARRQALAHSEVS